ETSPARTLLAGDGARYRFDKDLLRDREAGAASRGQGAARAHAYGRDHRLRLRPLGGGQERGGDRSRQGRTGDPLGGRHGRTGGGDHGAVRGRQRDGGTAGIGDVFGDGVAGRPRGGTGRYFPR